jgi:hypothetical protein
MAPKSEGSQPTVRPTATRKRWLRRGAWTLAFLGLAIALTWLLAGPFLHPRTHLVLLAGDVVNPSDSPDAAASDYVVEDFRELLALGSVLHQDLMTSSGPLILGSLRSPDEMQQLADRLNEHISGRRDVLIVYATAHGVSEDGDAWLVAGGADSRTGGAGRYRLSGLLQSLQSTPAAVKLLILEAGRIDYEPARGLLDNDFTALVADQVEQSGDDSIWVLCSHSAGQRSHLSPALKRSVFGYFVAEGLRGLADANGDKSIDLAELNRFVTGGVSGWVRQTTGGTANQTPILMWGRGSPWPRSLPVIIAVPRQIAQSDQKLDHAKSIQQAQQKELPAGEATARGQREVEYLISRHLAGGVTQGRLGQGVSLAARKAFSKVTNHELPPPSEDKKEKSTGESKAGKSSEREGDPGASGTAAREGETPAEPKGASDSSSPIKKSDSQPPEKKSNGERTAAPASAPNGAKPAATKPPGPTYEQLSEQLQAAWRLRDELVAPTSPRSRPVDDAPHLWRLLEARLLALDRHLRTGFISDTSQFSLDIASIAKTLESLAAETPSQPPPGDNLAREVLAARPIAFLKKIEPKSLALAELIAREGGPPLSADLRSLIKRFDDLVAAGNRADLIKLAADLKPEHEQWLELRVVRQLATQDDADWRLVHLLLAATRYGEQAAAASLPASRWVRVDVERADAIHLAVERQLAVRAATARDTLIQDLTSATGIYQSAIVNLGTIRTAERLAHDLWHRLPIYLAWHASAGGSATVAPSANTLKRLIATLAELDQLLDSPASENIVAVKETAARLSALQAEVEKPLDPLAIEQLLTTPASPGENWRIELLLETPLLSAEMRAALTAAVTDVDAALAAQVKPPASAVEESNNSLRVDDDRFATRADLQVQLWQAADGLLSLPEFDNLREAWRRWNQSSKGRGAAAGQSLDLLRQHFRTALEDLVRDLPSRVQKGIEEDRNLTAAELRRAKLARLQSWDRLLRLVDPSSLALADGLTSPRLADGAAYDLLVWLRQRAERQTEDAPPSQATYLKSLAQSYAAAAAAIPRQPPVAGGAPSPIEITGPAQIALTYDAQRPVEIIVSNVSSVSRKIWLAGQWDADLVSVTTTSPQPLYNWTELLGGSAENVTALTERVTSMRASLELAPGQKVAVPLLLVRQKPSLHASYLAIRALTEGNAARHDAIIQLPPPEFFQLTVAAPRGMWSLAPGGLTLYPFPNRTNNFVLELSSGQSSERKVDVEVFPLLSPPPRDMPVVPLLGKDAERLRSQLSLGTLTAEARGLALPPGDERIKIPLTGPQPPGPPPPAAGQPPAPKAADAKKMVAAPPPEKPPPVPLKHGLLLIVKDLKDQQQSFKYVEIAAQRPQRYIRPQVRYRAGRERIEVKVTAQDPLLLPADGVRIRGEIDPPLAVDAERQLDAVLNARTGEAELFAEIPSAAGRTVTLQLTIDDYPRAISFRVPCVGETADVPEDMDLLAARILGLPKGAIYKPPVATIPLQLAIDAPASALKNPALRVEAGIDRNRDRELQGDEVIVLTTDRQAEASLVGIGKGGELEIQATVRDFTVDLPAVSVPSGRANVLVHVLLGDNEAWSEPVEIAIDGQAPHVSAVELRPTGVVVIGTDLVVSALADDLGLSGIAKVEATFDLDRSGQFGAGSKPTAGALGEDGRWVVKLPTAGMGSGAYNVLVRATDRAGNDSQPVRASIRLLTADEAKADDKSKNAADVTGVVMYGDQPQAGAKVTLATDAGTPPPPPAKGKKKTADAKPALATATTDGEGNFRFPKVAPGKYIVTAEALVRNKNRTAQEKLSFEKPQQVQPLTLKLK